MQLGSVKSKPVRAHRSKAPRVGDIVKARKHDLPAATVLACRGLDCLLLFPGKYPEQLWWARTNLEVISRAARNER